MDKKWNYLCDGLSGEDVRKLAAKHKISQVLAAVLLNRGIDLRESGSFLNGSAELLHDPFLMKDMEKGVESLEKALENGDKITVYGDYDVDGISASSMLFRYLKSRGGNADIYIPDRETEGYGVNAEAVRKIAGSGTRLIVTVDTGITAIPETVLAKELGLDIIICDHHACGAEVPQANAVINPKQCDCRYPYSELSGTGVAFKLICALSGGAEKPLRDYAEYVALATIADVVPLKNENRELARIGLQKMQTAKIPWLDALFNVSAIKKESVSAGHIGFMIAPRINAAGRIGDVRTALNLLCCDDEAEAYEMARVLDTQNSHRKEIGQNIFNEAVEMIEEGEKSEKRIIVLAHEDWHPGIIGITASRIADLYHRSVILLSVSEDGTAKGSGRAIRGINLYDALCSCRDILTKFGGHDLAAGLTLPKDNIDEFEKRINAFADGNMDDEDLIPTVNIDCRLSCEGNMLRLCRELTKLEPIGTGNAKPVFAVLSAKVSAIKKSRDGKHLILKIIKNGKEFSAIGFAMGDFADTAKKGDTVSFAAYLEENEFMGNVSPQFQLVDIIGENDDYHRKAYRQN